MSIIPGAIPVTGFLGPTDSSDTYAVTDAIYGIDGFRSVSASTVRNAISTERRREGMLVYTQDDGNVWQLLPSPWVGTSADWRMFISSAATSSLTANTTSSNGLTKTGNNITLGGALTGNTYIDNAGFLFRANEFSATTISAQTIHVSNISGFSPVNLYNIASLDASVENVWDTSYSGSVIMKYGTSISSNNGGGQIDLDWGIVPNYVAITSDNGNGLYSLTEISNDYTGISNAGDSGGTQSYMMGAEFLYDSTGGLNNVSNFWSSGLKSLVNIGVAIEYSPTYEPYQDIVIQQNATNASSVGLGIRDAIFIGANNSTINAGVKNTVVMAGSAMTATQSNSLYTQNARLAENGGAIYSAGTDLYGIFAKTSQSGGTSASLWSGSTGSNSIIANNSTGNLASGAYSIVGGKNSSGTSAYSIVTGGWNNLSSAFFTAIINGYGNNVTAEYSTIGNGYNNRIDAQRSFIGSGVQNKITASANKAFIGGGQANSATTAYAIVVGGRTNISSGNRSVLVGGQQNQATGAFSLVGAGYKNSATTTYSTVVGGKNNLVSGTYSFVGAGYRNTVSASFSTIVGGIRNEASGQRSFVGGGSGNTASGNYSSVLAGQKNQASGIRSFVGGGQNNSVTTNFSAVVVGENNSITPGAYQGYGFIGGGKDNSITSKYGIVVGGSQNTATGGYWSTTVGGYKNMNAGGMSFVGGGVANSAATGSYYATIVGGKNNYASQQGTIVAGTGNRASGQATFIGCGISNTASAQSSLIVGGSSNLASGVNSFIGGGLQNSATTIYSTVIGGKRSRASGGYSFVGNGKYNLASGLYSSVLNGSGNTASGQASAIIGGTGHTISGRNSVIAGGGSINGSADDTLYAQKLTLVEPLNSPLNFPIFIVNPVSPVDGDIWILSGATGNALLSIRIGGLTKTVELS